jgi:hypothetical protein
MICIEFIEQVNQPPIDILITLVTSLIRLKSPPITIGTLVLSHFSDNSSKKVMFDTTQLVFPKKVMFEQGEMGRGS